MYYKRHFILDGSHVSGRSCHFTIFWTRIPVLGGQSGENTLHACDSVVADRTGNPGVVESFSRKKCGEVADQAVGSSGRDCLSGLVVSDLSVYSF